MTKLIIVKYASNFKNKDIFTENDSVVGSYSANQCGVTQVSYSSVIEAESDLNKMRDFNPSVDYGLVLVI